MIRLKLNHVDTPEQLVKINDKICTVIANSPLDDKLLLQLVEERDIQIQLHLNSLTLQDRKRFAEFETKSNQILTKEVKKELKSSLSQLSGLIKGKKAVDKYK